MVRREGGFDSMFDFPLYYAITDVFWKGAPLGRPGGDPSLRTQTYGAATSLVTLVDNHDLPRLLTACGGDRAMAETALRFLFAMRGHPLDYLRHRDRTHGREGARQPGRHALRRALLTPLGPLQEQHRSRDLAGASVTVGALSAEALEVESPGHAPHPRRRAALGRAPRGVGQGRSAAHPQAGCAAPPRSPHSPGRSGQGRGHDVIVWRMGPEARLGARCQSRRIL